MSPAPAQPVMERDVSRKMTDFTRDEAYLDRVVPAPAIVDADPFYSVEGEFESYNGSPMPTPRCEHLIDSLQWAVERYLMQLTPGHSTLCGRSGCHERAIITFHRLFAEPEQRQAVYCLCPEHAVECRKIAEQLARYIDIFTYVNENA